MYIQYKRLFKVLSAVLLHGGIAHCSLWRKVQLSAGHGDPTLNVWPNLESYA